MQWVIYSSIKKKKKRIVNQRSYIQQKTKQNKKKHQNLLKMKVNKDILQYTKTKIYY